MTIPGTSELKVLRDAPMRLHTTWRIGGPADFLVRAGTSEDLVAAVAWGRSQGLPVTVLGGGSNLLVDDDGGQLGHRRPRHRHLAHSFEPEDICGIVRLNFTDTTTPFTSFILTSSSGFAGFDVSDVSLTGGLLTIDLRGTENTQGGQIALQLSSAAVVPEPSTWAMLLLGFGAVGFAIRRRRKTGFRPQIA